MHQSNLRPYLSSLDLILYEDEPTIRCKNCDEIISRKDVLDFLKKSKREILPMFQCPSCKMCFIVSED